VIAIVIVTFSGDAAMLDACIASVRTAGSADHIIIVDNGGRAVVEASAGSGVELIRQDHNLGFGGGANAGFRRAAELGAQHVALLNDDIEVDPGWLEPLVAALRSDGRLGAVQPKLLRAGSQPARVNSVGVVIGRDGAGNDIGFDEIDGPGFTSDRAIESFTGGAVLFTAAFLDETHGFDESYFLYYEDVDLAKRGAELGWTYQCVPKSIVWHRVSASTAQLGDRARYLQERNRLRFVLRFGDRGMVVRALWLSLRRLRWAPRWVHARALAAGLVSAPSTLLARRVARRAGRRS
jgi:N-acetylglucosaminyl-diphospho-decaprenol L-rhamnosyltransferase